MDSTLLGAVGLIAAVLVAGLLMRRGSNADAATAPRPDRAERNEADEADGDDAIDELLDEVSAGTRELGHDAEHAVAVTSDGASLVADRHAVRLVPPESEELEAWQRRDAGTRARDLRGDAAMAASWSAGDLTGVRVVRGQAEEAPWRLDALGRDGEYTMLLFEEEAAAQAARDLFVSKRIVRAELGDDDQPVPPSREQFEEARRIYLETIAELEAGDGEDGAR